MEGSGSFIALTFLLFFLAIFFSILLILQLSKIRLRFMGGIVVGFIAILISIFLIRSDLFYEIDWRITLFYLLIVFFGWLLSLVFRRNK